MALPSPERPLQEAAANPICCNSHTRTTSIGYDQVGSASRYHVQYNADLAVTGHLPDEYTRGMHIVRYDRGGQETRRWTLHGAWIKVLEYDDLEGWQTAVVVW